MYSELEERYCFQPRKVDGMFDGWLVTYTNSEGNDGEGFMYYTAKEGLTREEAQELCGKFSNYVSSGREPSQDHWRWLSAEDIWGYSY